MPIPVSGTGGGQKFTFFCRGCKHHFPMSGAYDRKGDTIGDIWVGPYCQACAKKFPHHRLAPQHGQATEPPRRA